MVSCIWESPNASSHVSFPTYRSTKQIRWMFSASSAQGAVDLRVLHLGPRHGEVAHQPQPSRRPSEGQRGALQTCRQGKLSSRWQGGSRKKASLSVQWAEEPESPRGIKRESMWDNSSGVRRGSFSPHGYSTWSHAQTQLGSGS